MLLQLLVPHMHMSTTRKIRPTGVTIIAIINITKNGKHPILGTKTRRLANYLMNSKCHLGKAKQHHFIISFSCHNRFFKYVISSSLVSVGRRRFSGCKKAIDGMVFAPNFLEHNRGSDYVFRIERPGSKDGQEWTNFGCYTDSSWNNHIYSCQLCSSVLDLLVIGPFRN
jgi:hypothetical protein